MARSMIPLSDSDSRSFDLPGDHFFIHTVRTTALTITVVSWKLQLMESGGNNNAARAAATAVMESAESDDLT